MKLTGAVITFTVGDETSYSQWRNLHRYTQDSTCKFVTDCRSYTTNCKSDDSVCKFCQPLQLTSARTAIQLTITRGGHWNQTQCVAVADLRGAPGMHALPLSQNVFIFMQFSGKIRQTVGWRPPPLRVGAPPLGNPRSATVGVFENRNFWFRTPPLPPWGAYEMRTTENVSPVLHTIFSALREKSDDWERTYIVMGNRPT